MNRRAAIFFLLYVAAVLYLSLYPFEFLPHSRSLMLFWVESSNRRISLDTLLNILFYVPLGAAAVRSLGRSGPAWIASVLFGTLLSLGIEFAQLFTPSRFGNLRDLAANSGGTILGASAAYVLLHPRIAPRISPSLDSVPWRISPAGALFLTLWLLWQTFPFVPNISLYALVRSWGQVRQMEWSWITAGGSMVGFYVLALAVGPISRWSIGAFLVLPLQVFVANHSLSISAIVGGLAGWAASLPIRRPWVAAATILAWMSFEEFRPFRLTVQPQAFVWAPFQAWYEAGTQANYSLYFSKTFLYTSAVWALRRCGIGWPVAILVPAAILIAGEWTQRILVGRTPETTDLALLAAGAVLLKLCERRASGV